MPRGRNGGRWRRGWRRCRGILDGCSGRSRPLEARGGGAVGFCGSGLRGRWCGEMLNGDGVGCCEVRYFGGRRFRWRGSRRRRPCCGGVLRYGDGGNGGMERGDKSEKEGSHVEEREDRQEKEGRRQCRSRRSRVHVRVLRAACERRRTGMNRSEASWFLQRLAGRILVDDLFENGEGSCVMLC